MNILVIGSGGREHALVWKLRQSKLLKKVFIAPGNAGTAMAGTNLPIDADDFDQIGDACIEHHISIVVVGPEQPLVDGIADYFQNNPSLSHIGVVGPGSAGAMLEGSKAFAKEFMNRHGIPTAGSFTVDAGKLEEGKSFLKSLPQGPYVLKADGLAAGKGVLIVPELSQAINELELMISGKFGKASRKVVIEEFLSGIEVSVFVVTDGKNYRILPAAKDYKRIGESDTGLNTGGMGAVSPVVFADSRFLKKVDEKIIKPTIKGLIEEGIDYKGFIFLGLMNVREEPYLIEYNVRLGDPEAECVLPRIKSDLAQMFEALVNGRLSEYQLETDDRYAVTVVVASGGYPEDFQKGKMVSGLNSLSDCVAFHGGTATDITSGGIKTAGGRVFALTALGYSLEEARNLAYLNVSRIHFEKAYSRKDIGLDLIHYQARYS
jgi:phosphoribosylamine--glycine ligase